MGTAWIRLTVDHFEEAKKIQCYNHFYQAKPYKLSEHNSKINCKYTKFINEHRKNQLVHACAYNYNITAQYDILRILKE